MIPCVIKNWKHFIDYFTFDFVDLHPPESSSRGEYENFSMQLNAATLSMAEGVIGDES